MAKHLAIFRGAYVFVFVLLDAISSQAVTLYYLRYRHEIGSSEWNSYNQQVGDASGLFRSSHPEVFLVKKCSGNIQRIYRRTPMPKYDFNKVEKQFSHKKM